MNISPIDYVHILKNTFLCDRFNHSSRDFEGSCKYLLWKADILRVVWPSHKFNWLFLVSYYQTNQSKS